MFFGRVCCRVVMAIISKFLANPLPPTSLQPNTKLLLMPLFDNKNVNKKFSLNHESVFETKNFIMDVKRKKIVFNTEMPPARHYDDMGKTFTPRKLLPLTSNLFFAGCVSKCERDRLAFQPDWLSLIALVVCGREFSRIICNCSQKSDFFWSIFNARENETKGKNHEPWNQARQEAKRNQNVKWKLLHISFVFQPAKCNNNKKINIPLFFLRSCGKSSSSRTMNRFD